MEAAASQLDLGNKFLINIWLCPPHTTPILTSAMIDSGADGNFIDRAFALRYNLAIDKKEALIPIVGIDGRPLGNGHISEEVRVSVTCESSSNIFHSEQPLRLDVITSPNYEVILGFPWLCLHCPQTNWSLRTLCFNSGYCNQYCRFSEIPPTPISVNSVNSEPSVNSVNSVPSVNHVNSANPVSSVNSAFSTLPEHSVRTFANSESFSSSVNSEHFANQSKTCNHAHSVNSAPQPTLVSTPELQEISNNLIALLAAVFKRPGSQQRLEEESERIVKSARNFEQTQEILPKLEFRDYDIPSEEDFFDCQDEDEDEIQNESEIKSHHPISDDNPSSVSTVWTQADDAEFEDVFKKTNAGDLPPHRPEDCAIDFVSEDKEPPCDRVYPISHDEDKLLVDYIDEYSKLGFIRPSMSSAGAPIFFVEKEKGKKRLSRKPLEKRLVVNYKGLDKITKKFRYPLPLIEELFDRLRNAKIFSKIDLRSAYHLLRIREGDEWKTAFRTKYGLYEYTVMPFGLANAPAYFQKFINNTFKDMIGKFVVIYMDDFLIYSEDPTSHREHIRAVLQRLRENKLYAKREKCKFGFNKVKFLGYEVSAYGRKSNEDQVRAVKEWPAPSNRKELEKFLGFANYLRRFVKEFAEVCIPLHKLLRKDTPFTWSTKAQKAFEELKRVITSAPVLMHVQPREPIWIETDASDFALGGVLLQKDKQGELRPCAFYSRSLRDAEKNYCTYEKELLAIKVTFDEWRHYLEGAPHQITVISDHKGLETLADAKVMSQRHARWSLFFKRFDFVIQYRPGSKNLKADALSRRPDYMPLESESLSRPAENILEPSVVQVAATFSNKPFMEKVKSASSKDEFYHKASDKNENLKKINGLLFKDGRLYVPEGELRMEALRSCHDSPLAGHFGRRKTAELLDRNFWWPRMEVSVQEYCDSCDVCMRAKGSRHKPYGLLMPLQVANRPWSSVSMDFIVDLPQSAGMTAIYVVVDRFTKMAHFIPIKGLPSAEETAELFIQHVLRLHGVPEEIISDRGSQFVSHFWKRFLELLNIKRCLSTAYHPQSDGQTERTNQTLEQYLRCFVSYHQDDWHSFLPLAEFAFNNTISASTKLTPFYAYTGTHPKFEFLSIKESIVPAVEDRFRKLEVVHQELRDNLAMANQEGKRFWDQHRKKEPEFVVGEEVWLDSQNVSLGRPCPKLDHKNLGPYKVRRRVGKLSYELELPPWLKIHPVFHVSLLEKVKKNSMSDRRQVNPPPPVIVEDHEEYMVSKILDSRIIRNRLQYFIDWEGYPPSERCWVYASEIHAPIKIKEFHKLYPSKPVLTSVQHSKKVL